jgi:competence protein ComEA
MTLSPNSRATGVNRQESTDKRALLQPHPKEPIMIRNLIATVLAVFALNAFAAVDVNRASQAELETVKGIGPGLSSKILEARKSGDFKSWTDMVERVSGIGEGNAARFSQAGLTVGGSTFAAAPRVEKSAEKGAEKSTEKNADKVAKKAP